MKKIIFLFLLLLTSCMTDYDKAPALRDYSKGPFLELPVSRILVVSKAKTDNTPPHAEHLMPMSVERFIKSWAAVHLHPTYKTQGKAQFIINEASMIQEDAPENSFFVYDNYKYQLKYQIAVVMYDETGHKGTSFEVEGFLSRTLPKKASQEQRDNMFTHMLNDLEEQLNREIKLQIQENHLDQ